MGFQEPISASSGSTRPQGPILAHAGSAGLQGPVLSRHLGLGRGDTRPQDLVLSRYVGPDPGLWDSVQPGDWPCTSHQACGVKS